MWNKRKFVIFLSFIPQLKKIINFHIGFRDLENTWEFLIKIPKFLRKKIKVYCDKFVGYKELIPIFFNDYEFINKKGNTNHIERLNLTLRHFISSLRRKSLVVKNMKSLKEDLEIFVWLFNNSMIV